MSYLSIFIISFTIALSGALVPGPLLTAVIYESTKHGVKAGPLMMLGHALLEIAMIIFIIFGFTHFMQSQQILKTISVLGALILIYFGIKMLSSLKHLSLETASPYKQSTSLIMTGITMSAANPYWTIWWLTIGLGLLLGAQKVGLSGLFFFFLGHILADIFWYTFVSIIISKSKKFISAFIYRLVISICAFTLIGFGIYFGATGLINNL